ncbi:alanyl-tRNA editing protein Aarsd1 isoform X1 [Euwallacea fornicatus]|uniref:alanyl-tRNA editing protein Aarsd1 isoform X1 n=1 Tax=Euwallacea fornicatus TaxID=995702 RepID=UPI0033903E6C
MVFKCQSDAFLKEFSSKVITCEKIQQNHDKPNIEYPELFEVILEDTILFPEGGGQPCDYGSLNEIPVIKVIRRADKAIHITNHSFSEGEEVRQKINWERRFDHMQQHSGQHLVTAVIDREFKYSTVSWWLGEEVSYIELDTPKITDEEIREAENKINSLIRDGKRVSVEVYTEGTSEEELKQVRARGLPEDHKGDIRVINIEDLERNMCCGTHVTNLSQLQVVKLLHSEKSKRKDKTFLYFLVGNRILNRLTGCIEREQKLTALLKSNPVQHPELADKLQKTVKILNKNVQGVLKDLAFLQAKNLNDTLPVPAFFSLHRKEAEPDFMNTFIRELGDKGKDIFLFLSTGDEKLSGNIVLYGPEKIVADLGPKISELLEGKGAGKGNKFQAKVMKMANRSKAEAIIKDYFKN